MNTQQFRVNVFFIKLNNFVRLLDNISGFVSIELPCFRKNYTLYICEMVT